MKIKLGTWDGSPHADWAYIAEFWQAQGGSSVIATGQLSMAEDDDLIGVRVVVLSVGCGEDGTITVAFPANMVQAMLDEIAGLAVMQQPPACTCFLIAPMIDGPDAEPAEWEQNPYCPQHPDEFQQRVLAYTAPGIADQLRQGKWPSV